MSNRENILQAIIDDPSSTESEIRAARKELKRSEVASDEDIELEHFLAGRNVPGQQIERREWRQTLSAGLQQLIDDITSPSSLLIIPDAGSADRLRALLKRTKSDIVTRHVLASLTSIQWMQNVKEAQTKGTDATTPATP